MMTDSNYSSTSSLCDLESMRANLEAKENLLQRAAQYGKDLVDQNKELSDSLEDVNRRYTRQMEVLKEENYSLTQKLEQKQRMEDEYQDEIESLKKHLASQRDELKVLNDLTDQSIAISELRNRLREIEAVSDKSELENKQLKALISSYKDELEEANNKIRALQDNLNDSASDEVSELMKELNETTKARDEFSRTCMLHENKIHSLTQQLESQVHQISSLQDELLDANSQLSSMSNSFVASTQENQDLRCEIDMLRMNDRDHKKKGNSMFSELDDKRQEAEKKLLLLNVQYESLVNRYDLSKKQMNKLKLQVSNILRMTSGQVDSNHLAELESQLSETRKEVQSLTTKLARLTTVENSNMPQSVKDSLSGDEDLKTVQFVESLLKTKDEELEVMKRELQEKRLAATYNTQRLNDVQHQLRSMETKANKLHAQNIQLSVKLEEIKTKYEVESNSGTQLGRGQVEDIPDFNAEVAQALLGSSANTTEPATPVSDRTDIVKEEPRDDVKEEPRSDMSQTHTEQSTCSSDNHSLSEIQNVDGPPRHRKPGLYFNKPGLNSPMSSTNSLWSGDQANVNSCDSFHTRVAEKKVVNVKGSNQDPNNCPTQ